MADSALPRDAFDVLRLDPAWRMKAYRLAIEALDDGWTDSGTIARHRVTREVAAQLYDALGSIGANLSEGYSRSSGLDRVRMYEYALGSARESVVWYFAARHVIGNEVAEKRIARLQEIIALLLTMIPKERSRRIRRGET
jgi:four helix bundle protein